jgi:hypothetical protein
MRASLPLLLLAASLDAAPLAAAPWREAPLSADAASRSSTVRELALDLAVVRGVLAAAPSRGASGGVVLALPRPAGGERRFAFTDAGVIPTALQVRYPQLRAFRGVALDDPRVRVRAELTTRGFGAMVFGGERVEIIEPLEGDRYVSYEREWRGAAFRCGVRDHDAAFDPLGAASTSAAAQPEASGPTLRTYRMAVAATREFTEFWSQPGAPNVAAGLSGVVQAVNRVDEVYQSELAIHLELVANNDLIIYIAEPDPYTNGSGSTMLGQNQANLDSVIGAANYDFGHVVSTGGGGVASLNSVCNAASKARGVTGSSSPTGDPFWIDYVAHEMGHQLNANHTFNGTTGSCGGGNRSGSNAYEPGSGSTIMAYAGICGAENLQPNSDPYFHARSLEVIHNYTQTGTGSTCGTAAATGNLAPVVDAGATFTIPARTPFALTGSASDTAGDVLSYSWEQYNLGAATNSGTFGQDDGTRPLFRVFNPSAAPSRVFPRLVNLLSGTPSFGETLPTTNRSLAFRLVARDDRAGGGGVAWDATTLTVVDTGAPFRVTAPNTATTWIADTAVDVTWDVSGTSAGPIACANVTIALSTDGGNTFPELLAASTANDGSAGVTVPALDSADARVRVACADNVFFDVSDVDFSIVIDPGYVFGDGFESP